MWKNQQLRTNSFLFILISVEKPTIQNKFHQNAEENNHTGYNNPFLGDGRGGQSLMGGGQLH